MNLKYHILWGAVLCLFLIVWVSLCCFVAVKISGHEIVNPETYDLGRPNACPESSPYLYYFEIEKCHSLVELVRNECDSKKVCLDGCPEIDYILDLSTPENIIKHQTEWDIWKNHIFCLKQRNSTESITAPDSFNAYLMLVNRSLCPKEIFRSNPFDNNVCVPTEVDHLKPTKHEDDYDEEGNKTRSDLEIYVMRRSGQMFTTWLTIACAFTAFFIVAYLLMFLYCIRTTVYVSLISFFLILLTGFSYSIAMVVLSIRKTKADPDFTFGISFGYWIGLTIIIFLFIFLYLDFLVKCYYSVPKAIRFLIYANRGIGGLRSILSFIIIGIIFQIFLMSMFSYLLYIVYSNSLHIYRISKIHKDCVCRTNYEMGSECTKSGLDYCHDRVSGGQCIEIECSLYNIELSSKHILIIAALAICTYYLMWFVKVTIDMILGTTFVFWYRDNFSTHIPFLQLIKNVAYCFKRQIGTLALGALIMFLLGLLHILSQFLEHLILYSVEAKRAKHRNFFVKLFLGLSYVTGPLVYVIASVENVTFNEAISRLNQALSTKFQNIRLINKLVDIVLFICALIVVMVTAISLLIVYAYPKTFFSGPKTYDIFTLMASPELIFVSILIGSYFLIGNILSMYSIAVNSIFISYITDIPLEVSRRRRYRSSKSISDDVNPDKFDVLGKVSDVGEFVSPGSSQHHSTSKSLPPVVRSR